MTNTKCQITNHMLVLSFKATSEEKNRHQTNEHNKILPILINKKVLRKREGPYHLPPSSRFKA